ncbi:hypothetical protein CH54_2099 [Yersinia rochesterensis]|uniref:Integrase n=1 Tax=Yersinia rochesterensis TaxID=1604335 RepID=A0ABN4FCS3_9GAMM|nr:hypothetical protein AW19_3691 [Yersinia frederiksenii Y225]AJJ35187.1 hypothetical protein CH54_2099 [Yersinia rochesterensis]
MNINHTTLYNHREPIFYPTLLSEHSVAYREYLVSRGYTKSYIQRCEEVVAHFSRWM